MPLDLEKVMFRFLIAAVLILFLSPAYASEDTNADDWAAKCSSKVESEQGVCAGSVSIFVDMIEVHARAYPDHRMVCWDPTTSLAGATEAQKEDEWLHFRSLALIAVDYLKSNPTYAKAPAPALMLAAFMRKWPCGTVGPLNKP